MGKCKTSVKLHWYSGADLRFPVGGGANPPGGGRQHTNLPDFPKNCRGRPLESTTGTEQK